MGLIGQTLGRYQITELLGEGGMASVYKAFDTRLECDVAIKVIRMERFAPEMAAKTLKRFEREAKALAQLTHPNIVKVTDYGEFGDKPYLVMPYLSGGTLKQRMNQPMPWWDAFHYLIPIARALEYAHRHGILHRDIKPTNILITDASQPMLTDFGVAKLLDIDETAELTSTGTSVGTPEYMAPEQATSGNIDQRADVYSLGIVLYEMITGHKPFSGDTPLSILFMHASAPLPPPTTYIKNLPPNVEAVLLRSLAKNPNQRYTNMAQFSTAMENLLSGSQFSHGEQLARTGISKPTQGGEKPKWARIGVISVFIGVFCLGILLCSGLTYLGIQGTGPLSMLATDTSTPRPTPTRTPTYTPTPSPIPATIGYYDTELGFGPEDDYLPIQSAGYFGFSLTGLTSQSISGTNILFILNPDNYAFADLFVQAFTPINESVWYGSVLIFHDRLVTGANTVLPGGQYIQFHRNPGSDIQISGWSTSVTYGPGGTLSDDSLDGGNSSYHGYADVDSLPNGANVILVTNDNTQAVMFSYPYGYGWVIYSTIPLDYYLDADNRDEWSNFSFIYAPNIIQYAVDLLRTP